MLLEYGMKNEEHRKFMQQKNHKLAIEMKEDGHTNTYIAKNLGFHHVTISRWLSRYKKYGYIPIEERGRRKETYRSINGNIEKKIIKNIVEKTPKELGLGEQEVWTRKAVGTLIHGVSKTTRNNYLKRWQFEAKFPQIFDDIEENEYEGIYAECELKKGQVHWLEKKTYVLESNHKIQINMLYSVTKTNKIKFMLYEQNFSEKILILFLNRLIANSDTKICLILNNFNVNIQTVDNWVIEHQAQIIRHHISHSK